MTSEKQVEANRRNAQASTGPRTEAGKATVSQNALKFAFTGKEVLLPGEDPTRLNQMIECFCQEHHADTQTRRVFCVKMAKSLYREEKIDARMALIRGEEGEDSPNLFKLEGYRKATVREFDKALKTLRELGKDSQAQQVEKLCQENQKLAKDCKDLKHDYEEIRWGGQYPGLDAVRLAEIFENNSNPFPERPETDDNDSTTPLDS